MADNRVAKGIVLVPCVLLGGAFLATAVWGQGPLPITVVLRHPSVWLFCWPVSGPSG